MKHIFIMNPNAGKKQKEDFVENIKRVFKETEFYIEITKGPKDATRIAKYYAQSGIEMCIYACGGDGTLYEVVNGMKGYPNASLGIVPIGTGNDFVKSLTDYKKEDFLHVENYLHPTFMHCDLLDVNGHISLNTTSIGFDVGVAAGVSTYRKLPFSSNTIPYMMSLCTSILKPLGFPMRISLDGNMKEKQEYSFVVASNGKYYGGGFLPCPNAQINDGYIDVCLVKKIKHIQIPALIGSYKNGTHAKYKHLVEMRRVKKMQIIAKEPIELCLDGEILKILNPTIQIMPSAIRLCLPKLAK